MTKPSITPENIVKHVTVSNILNSSLDITSVFILKVSIISSSAIPRTIRVVMPDKYEWVNHYTEYGKVI